jgi:hypothetical protein
MRLLLFLAVGAVLAGTAPAHTGAARPHEITISGVERPWAIIFPLTSAGEPTTYHMAEKERFRLEASLQGQVLVCSGGDQRATQCERASADDGFAHGFTLDEGRAVTGRCLIGRRPAANATVSVRLARLESRRTLVLPLALTGEKWVSSTKVDDAGRFRIEHLAPGEYIFEVVTTSGRAEDSDIVVIPALKAAAPGQPPPPRTWEVPDIRLAEGIALTVEVRASDGTPVANAGVGVSQGQDGELATRSFEQRADESGVARFDGIEGLLGMRVSCLAPGFARFSEVFTTHPPLVTCALQRLGGVSGRVIDSQETAVIGATVALIGGDGAQAVTDSTGVFRFKDVVPGDYGLRATSAMTGTAVRDVTIAEGDVVDVGAISVLDAESGSGEVLSAVTGRPIANAAVIRVDPPGGTVSTDTDGKFSLPCDPSAPTVIRVIADGYAPQRSVLRPSSPDSATVIRLQKAGALEVAAWDEAGEPCRGCTILVSAPGDLRSAAASDQGVAHFDGLTPGEYQVTRERTSATSRQVVVSGGGDLEIGVVQPERTTRVELGKPARAFHVTLDPPPFTGARLWAYSRSRMVATTLESTGSFSFPRVQGEAYELRLETDGAGVVVAKVAANEARDLLTVQLGSATAEIRLTAAGTPAGNVQADFLDASGVRRAWAITDRSGTARVFYLPPGQYTVIAHARPLGAISANGGAVTVLEASVD